MTSKDEIHKYLSKIGKKGGYARAAKYDKETLRKWAKRGGRPKKDVSIQNPGKDE